MKKKTKTLILSIVVTLILLLTFTITYAVYTYQGNTDNQQIVLGDIYMHYEEKNALHLENIMPGDEYSKYFEFTISGKNTYTKQDIYYDVTLTRGDVPEDKIESNRISDNYLLFKLIEVNEDNSETEILKDKTYSDLTNRVIHVETIPKNTTSEINKTYRLYMTISNELVIGNTSDATYTTEEWAMAFASVKVNVSGDFNEREVPVEATDASCFETETITKYTVNPNMTEEIINTCVSYFYDIYTLEIQIEESWESFCQGTGTYYGYTFQEHLDHNYFNEYQLNNLEENNIIVNNGFSGVKINDYDESCGSDVVIPKTINNYSVTKLGEDSFSDKNLTSVEIPNTVTTIEGMAFSNNNLTKLVIPDSVIIIGQLEIDRTSYMGGTFRNNQLLTVEIGNGIELIGIKAFEKSSDSNPNLESIVIDKPCDDIKNIMGDYFNGTAVAVLERRNFYPWLSSSTPYTASGVTIIGSDGVCDTF